MKQRIKPYAFNQLTQYISEAVSKLRNNLMKCPLPKKIEDQINSIFHSLIKSIPKLELNITFDTQSTVKSQLMLIMSNDDDYESDQYSEEINFDGFWEEWVNFRESIYTLSSLSVVDNIYKKYIDVHLKELQSFIDDVKKNFQSRKELPKPKKTEFEQVEKLVNKAVLTLKNLTFSTENEENEADFQDQQQEEERIKDLMLHCCQIRHIKNDFSTRYKNFFQMSVSARSVAGVQNRATTDVQHQRCVSIIGEMLNATSSLSLQYKNFSSLKEELYLAEQKIMNEIVPPPQNFQMKFIRKDRRGQLHFPVETDEKNIEFKEEEEDLNYTSDPDQNDTSQDGSEPPMKPDLQGKEQIQPLDLKNMQKRFNSSDSEFQSNPASTNSIEKMNKQKNRNQGSQNAKQNLDDREEFERESNSNRSERKRKNEIENKSSQDAANESKNTANQKKGSKPKDDPNSDNLKAFELLMSSSENGKNEEELNQNQINRKSQFDNQSRGSQRSKKSFYKASRRTNQTSSESQADRRTRNEIEELQKQADSYKERHIPKQGSKKEDALSNSSHTSGNEDSTTLSRYAKLKMKQSPITSIDEKNENQDNKRSATSLSNKQMDNSDDDHIPLLYQRRSNRLSASANRLNTKPKKKSSNSNISLSNSIFSSSSTELVNCLNQISAKSQKKNKHHHHHLSDNGNLDGIRMSSSAPSISSVASSQDDGDFQDNHQLMQSPSSPLVEHKAIFSDDDEGQQNPGMAEERNELTQLKNDYKTLLHQLDVYSEENKELQAQNEDIPLLKKQIYFLNELVSYYEEEINRFIQIEDSLTDEDSNKSKEEILSLEISKLQKEKDQMFAKLQRAQNDLTIVTKKMKFNQELWLELQKEREKNEKLEKQIKELTKSLNENPEEDQPENPPNPPETEDENKEEKRIADYELGVKMAKQQIMIQNQNLEILHLKSKLKRCKVRLSKDETDQSKEKKEISTLKNEIATMRNGFESIQKMRSNQQDELFKEQTKNTFLLTTIDKLKEKVGKPDLDLDGEMMSELKEQIHQNSSLKNENEKIKSTFFELYHLICGESLTDNVSDMTILLDGIRQHLA